MGTTPFPGNGVAAQLEWLADRLGAAGIWLVETERRTAGSLHTSRTEIVVDDLVGCLARLTSEIPDAWCPSGSLDVHGIQVGSHTPAGPQADGFVDIDGGSLDTADPEALFRVGVRVHFQRLPAMLVDPVRRIVSRSVVVDRDRELIHAFVWQWSKARAAEVGGFRRDQPGEHLLWARAGHAVVTLLADRLDARDTLPFDRLLIDGRDDLYADVIELAHQVVAEHGLAAPAYGPLCAERETPVVPSPEGRGLA